MITTKYWRLVLAPFIFNLLLVNCTERELLLEDYICTGMELAIQLPSASPITSTQWTIGFWAKVPQPANPAAQYILLYYYHTASTYARPHYFQTSGPSALSFYQNTNFMWTFSSSGALNGALDASVQRGVAGNDWHYISLALDNAAANMAIILDRSVIGNVSLGSLHFLSDIVLILGSTLTTNTCSSAFHIHRFERFDIAFTKIDGSSNDQMYMYSVYSDQLTGLFKFDTGHFATKLFNLLNRTQQADRTQASSALLLNEPKLAAQNRFESLLAENTIMYPQSVFIQSPTDNSYVFFIGFSARVTRDWHHDCHLGLSTCATAPYVAWLYSRAVSAGPSSPCLAGLNLRLSPNSATITFESIVDNAPANSAGFAFAPAGPSPDQSPSPFVFAYISVRNLILDASPIFSSYIGPAPTLLVAAEISSVLDPADVHFTRTPEQTAANYFYLLIGETSFITGTQLTFDGVAHTLSIDNSLSPALVWTAGAFDLKRIHNNDVGTVQLNDASPTSGSACDLANCAYCESGVCRLCSLKYTLTAGTCVLCPNSSVYDYISRNCYTANASVLNAVQMDSSTFINNIASKIIVVNVLFDIPVDRDNSAAGAVTYVAYQNSLGFSAINVLEGNFYTSAQLSAELANVNVLFQSLANFIALNYAGNSNLVTRFAVVDPYTYAVPNPTLFPEQSGCHSLISTYQPIDAYKGTCSFSCSLGTFLSAGPPAACVACSANCALCPDAQSCTACFPGFVLANNGCGPVFNPFFQPANNSPASTSSPPVLNPTVDKEIWFSNGTSIDKNLEPISNATAVENVAEILKEGSAKPEPNNAGQVFECKKGYFSSNNACYRCFAGCISCPDAITCFQCDPNYRLVNNELCERVSGAVDAKNTTASSSSDCGACYQEFGVQSPGCQKCGNYCKCRLAPLMSQSTLLFECFNATLNRDFSQQAQIWQTTYNSKVLRGDFSLAIYPKSASGTFYFNIDYFMIKNTSQCKMNISETYSIDLSAINGNFKPLNISAQTFKAVSAVSESGFIVLGFLSPTLAESFLGFLQFNKIFVFLSLANIRVGGFFDYVNFNFQFSAAKQEGWLLWDNQAYDFKQLLVKMEANKVLPQNLFLFLVIGIFFSKICFGVGTLLSNLKRKPKLLLIGDNLVKTSYSIYIILSYKYGFVLVVNLPLFLRNAMLINNLLLKMVWLFFIAYLLSIPCHVAFKSFAYIKNTDTVKHSYFNSLFSKNQIDKNRELLRRKTLDNIFVVLKYFVLYQVRSYKTLMIVLAIVIIAAEIFVSAYWLNLKFVSIRYIRAATNVALIVFIALMLVRMMGAEIPTICFNIFYVVSNSTKLLEEVVLIFQIWHMNKRHKYRQEKLARRRQLH